MSGILGKIFGPKYTSISELLLNWQSYNGNSVKVLGTLMSARRGPLAGEPYDYEEGRIRIYQNVKASSMKEYGNWVKRDHSFGGNNPILYIWCSCDSFLGHSLKMHDVGRDVVIEGLFESYPNMRYGDVGVILHCRSLKFLK